MEVKLPTVVRLTMSLLVPGYITYNKHTTSNSFKKIVTYIVGGVENILLSDVETLDTRQLESIINLGLFKLGTLDYALLRYDQQEVMNKIIQDSLKSLYSILGEKEVTRYLQRLPIGELI